MSITFRQIIVGWDGSPAAERALGWAAHQAEHLSLVMKVVTVLPRRDHQSLPTPHPQSLEAEVAHLAADRAHRLREELRHDQPGLAVRVDVQYGDPADQLLEACSPTDLLVVGRTGTGQHRRYHPIGSVAAHVLDHARGAVALIPDHDWNLTAPVALGIEDAADANLLADTACRFAQANGGQVLALSAWELDALTSFNVGLTPRMTDQYQRIQEGLLEHALAPLIDRFPDVALRRLTIHANARQSFIAASDNASLLVLGYPRGPLGHHLWPIGGRVVLSARCPILLVQSPGVWAQSA